MRIAGPSPGRLACSAIPTININATNANEETKKIFASSQKTYRVISLGTTAANPLAGIRERDISRKEYENSAFWSILVWPVAG